MNKTVAAIGIIGGVVGYLFGGWSQLLDLLLAAVVIDFITGISAAAMTGSLWSRRGLIGLATKVIIFLIVALAHKVDLALGQGAVVETAALYGFIANEILSIIENAGRLGLPIPDGLLRMLKIFQAPSGESSPTLGGTPATAPQPIPDAPAKTTGTDGP